MILRIDHVAVAARDEEGANRFFRDVLGAVPGASAEDPGLKYRWTTHSLGDLSRLEIIAPRGENGFLAGFLRDRAGGVHHLTLQTDDIAKAKSRLDGFGVPWFGYNEYPGGVWKEIFIHPRDAFGVLIQIAEFEPDDWLASSQRLGGRRPRVERTGGGVALTLAHPGGGKVEVELGKDEARQLAGEILKALEES